MNCMQTDIHMCTYSSMHYTAFACIFILVLCMYYCYETRYGKRSRNVFVISMFLNTFKKQFCFFVSFEIVSFLKRVLVVFSLISLHEGNSDC
ncbi:hypothetical protein EDC96DRAFT_497903 [Choanephora cucurbitarum]|nr:hypothetical protein EDC96DRAFT_497903 [Choanephora cucurbitarum]